MNFDAIIEELLRLENLLVLIIAICVAAILGFASYLIYRIYMSNSQDQKYDKQFNELFVSEFDDADNSEKKDGLGDKWNHYWKLRTRKAAINRYDGLDNRNPGRDVIIATLAIGFLAGLITLQPLIGILAAIVVPIVYNIFLGLKINQVQASINSQVPAFLAAMKANIQANETPERALIKVIDDIGDPLYSELVPVKQRIQSGTELSDALDELKHRTTSQELKFLCSCIKLASSYGADLAKQIDVIQNVIAERQKIADKLASATRSARPAMLMGTLIIPAMFIFIYLFYEQAQDFWFVDPISYIALLLIIIFYAAGMWFTKMMVDGIKKM